MPRSGSQPRPEVTGSDGGAGKRVRADARRNIDALLRAASEIFAAAGVDVTSREIAEQAGLGVGTLYRHFPQRSDLIVAVYRHEVDACAAEAEAFAREHEPIVALATWFKRFVSFVAAKRGLAAAFQSGDPAYASLPKYLEAHLLPAAQKLLDAAVATGRVRSDVQAWDLLRAVGSLSTPPGDVSSDYAERMVTLLIDGLRLVPDPDTSVS